MNFSSNLNIYKYFICVASLLILSCSAKDEKVETAASDSRIGTTSEGGLPTLEETSAIKSSTETEATSASQSLKSVVTGSLAIDLGLSASGSSLHLDSGGGGGGDGLFGIASAFGLIYNMATGGARCNFDLLLNDEDGNAITMEKLSGYDVFVTPYGFGTVGLGDQGVLECPDRATVYDWARANNLITGTAQEQHTEDEFYIPSRMVIYKIDDNSFKWQVVFFPKDGVEQLVARIPEFAALAEEDLDFIMYSGVHEYESEDTGAGNITLDFAEVRRMVETLNSLGLRLTDEDEGMPDGKIYIEYDSTSSPTSITTTFKEGFTFGDDANTPFATESPTTIYKYGSEFYMHFVTPLSIVNNDEEEVESGDSGMPIQICPSEEQEGLGTGANDVPKADYLTAKDSHFQLIWTEPEDGADTPDNYMAELISDGGPFLYGEVVFQGGQKDGTSAPVIRIKAPTCEALTQAVLDQLETQFTVPLLDEDGFLNLNAGGGGGGMILSKADAIAGFPEFEHFKIVDINDEADSPIKD